MRRRPTSIRFGTTLGLAAMVAAAGACGGEQEASRLVRERLIAESPSRLLGDPMVGVQGELFVWSFADEEEVRRWEVVEAASAPVIESGALELEAATKDLRLVRAVEFAAAAVEWIEVRLAGPVNGPVKLYWAGEGEEPSEQRSQPASSASRVDSETGEWIAVVPVGRNFFWTGAVRTLRLDPGNTPGETVRLRSLTGFGLGPSAERELAVSGETLSIGVGDDFRPALVAAAGTTHRWRLPAGAEAGSTLEIGYALRCLVASTRGARYRFEVRGGDGADSTEESALLFEREIVGAAGGPDLEQWHEAIIDLPPTASGEIELSLAFDTDAGVGTGCVGAWANPVVTAPGPDPGNAPKPPDLLLISLDTVRTDRLGAGARSGDLSPRIDEWARRRGVSFPNTIAPAPWTLPSHTTMLTGLDPISHGLFAARPVPADFLLLAERLRDAGYETLAFTGGGFLDPRYGLDQGFERYVSARGAAAGSDQLESDVERLLEALAAPRRRPLFAFFHTYEPHSPYHRREPYFSRLHPTLARRDEDLARLGDAVFRDADGLQLAWTNAHPPPSPELAELANALYDSGIAYTDDRIGRLLDALERSGRADETIVVITSDHGEALGDEGRVGHGQLTDDNLIIPLIIAAPGARTGLVRDERVQLADIVPTLLELLGLPAERLDGSSLVPFLNGGSRPVETTWSYSRTSGVSVRFPDDVEYVMNPSPWRTGPGRERLFRIRPGRPEGRVGPAPPVDIDAMHQLVVERLRAMPGYWIRLENRTATTLSGTLELGGDGFDLAGVAAPGACACLRWTGDRIAFEVPEGESYGVLLAPDDAEDLRIRGRFGADEFEIVVPGGSIDGTRSVALGGGAPVLRDGALAGPAGFSLSWLSPRRDPGDDPELDPAVAERLRALGYIR